MSTNTNITLDIDAFINQATDLVSQQELFITDSVVINVDDLISEVSELISLPEVYLKIRELMDDPDSCLDDFAIVVSTDPSLIASVLKIVNSAFFGFTGQIDNVNRAINLIGIGPLHDLVLSLSALDALDLSNDIEELTLFWQRSIYCGVVSRLLAEKLLLKDAESLFVVGLLHEIGRLVLFLKYHKESKLAVIQAQTENLSLTEVEKTMFRMDYGQIGQALMAEWNLPLKFQCVTGCHPEPDTASEYTLETKIVHIAHRIAVNKFPEADAFQFPMDQDTLAILEISEDEINALCVEANVISLEVEKVILDKFS
ncbi:MAG: HDOD domain-containing protein [Thiotrichaceae bacterium]|nr:HDOD domain-containing protein [Thiotrichaceae bacterium]